MRILVIGLGELGRHVLDKISKIDSVDIEIYTRDFSKYEGLGEKSISCLRKLGDAKQPDLIFITANLYTPEDRLRYLINNKSTEKILDCRDDEKTTNREMMFDIMKDIKHLAHVPIIMTANPPELLVRDVSKEFSWSSVYNMQMMLDNARIAKITGLPESEYLCVGEHGRPIPTLAHLRETDNAVYGKISDALSKMTTLLRENLKGVPPKEEAKKALDKLIEAITQNRELRCVLTVPGSETKTGFGKPFIVKGLNFTEQPIPELSPQEQVLLRETQSRLKRKWGDEKELSREIQFKIK